METRAVLGEVLSGGSLRVPLQEQSTGVRLVGIEALVARNGGSVLKQRVFSGLPLVARPVQDKKAQDARRRHGHLNIVANAISTSTAPGSAPAAPKEETDVRVQRITDDTCSLRSCSLERLKFEIEYGLKRGTTDNSYLIKGENHTALIDVPDQAFSKGFVETLKSTIDLKDIKYLVIGHISPKRMESLTTLAEALPEGGSPIEIFCSNPAAQQLRGALPSEYLGKYYNINVVKSDECLDLGGGHKLQFLLTPTPRWPDGMCIYDPANQLLFSNKLFSAHVCGESGLDDEGWEEYAEDWRFFFDCMLSPVPKQAKAALEKLPIVAQFSVPSYSGRQGLAVLKADVQYVLSSVLSALKLPIDKAAFLSSGITQGEDLVCAAICPLHGPVVRSSVTELVREYRVWTEKKLKEVEEATIAVIYASAYGNTAALAQAISRGITKAGVGVESVNAEICSSEEITSIIKACNGFVVGSPTLGGHMPTPMKDAMGVILNDSDARSKPCGVFGSFGWSGEAVDEMEQLLKDGGFSFAFPALRCKFKPTESTLQTCEESGTDLAQEVKKAILKQKRSTGGAQYAAASNVEQAVGRVVGSLCVLTAKAGDAESAMLASWVSQASFVPPGLTIAVAKDRAVEGLVLTGSKFALSVLGQGKSGPVAKQLLKPFKPGESRLDGLQIKQTDSGLNVLSDAVTTQKNPKPKTKHACE
ncbi:hypothetical protein KC19_6G115700 [Ceratodon purpureus]|uniref:Flavodoxin-like domain-containing protein n=1 Tax=Ceratodon purpureus TaxID=3225 RepID=A0A8T0HHB4_CERPU|nr:hypothetical protein KC19_6G115700 [Ceratodon purpureus]